MAVGRHTAAAQTVARAAVKCAGVPGTGAHACARRANVTVSEFVRFENGEGQRPWYSEGSHSQDPDMLMLDAVAISTRVAPSFIRVGQLELFGRRARKKEHPKAMEELEKIVLHLIDREYVTSSTRN